MQKDDDHTVGQIYEKIHETDQLEDAARACLDIMMEATGSDKGSVWIYHDKIGRSIVLVTSGASDAEGESAGQDEGLVGQTVASGESKRIAAEDADGVRLAGADGPSVSGKNIMSVIIRKNDHIHGCLIVTGKSESYSEDDQSTLEECCEVIAGEAEEKGYEPDQSEDKEKEPVVSVRNIIKEYQNGEETSQVLKGIDLDVYPGELMVVLGESGCGKSTLLNIIGGMDSATSGEITVEGKDMSSPSENELTEYRRQYVGFIFQSYNLMPNLSAYENVEFIGEISDDPMDSMEALSTVDLEEKADSMPSELSGGQQQRVSIARAIVKNPKIILADEPTAALDHDTSVKVLGVIENVVNEKGTTVLMVTHNSEIAKMADRVVRLRDGKISSIRVNRNPLSAEELEW